MRKVAIFATPLLIVVTAFLIVNSVQFTSNSDLLSFAITVDLLLVSPLLYYFMIRNSKIPTTTIIPVVMLGLFAGFYVLPAENQVYLQFFKTWILPCIELLIVILVVSKIKNLVRTYHRNKDVHVDFYTGLRKTFMEVLPGKLVEPFITEIAVFYYGMISWKKRSPKENEFTYHKESGTLALLSVLVFLIILETTVIHLLLQKWSEVAAWILTGLSIYSALQIFGFLKSIIYRPILIHHGKLYLRYGIMAETVVDIDDIAHVALSSKTITKKDATCKLSVLGDLEAHNLIIHLKNEHILTGLYGTRKAYKNIAIFVDKKERFKASIARIKD